MTGELVARKIADEILFPAAMSVDTGVADLKAHLDLLAAEGFYGLAAPPGVGTLKVSGRRAACRVVEELASGCLTTAFVWVQHHPAVLAAAASVLPGVRKRWLAPLVSGRARAGLAIGATVRQGPATLRATAVDGGHLLDGEAPWVTGWGLIDTLYASARNADDSALWAFLDAVEGDTLRVEPVEMVAVAASRTVRVVFDRHFVPTERVAAVQRPERWSQPDAGTLRFNGSLALGVANRCSRLVDDGALRAQLDACRAALDGADPAGMPPARAAASELALRAAAALAVATGSRAVLLDNHAQRLMREATFLLVFGLRPNIRDALLTRLTSA
ncbi:acyl-CoA dehydrogenase family protein [Dactylosporangium sucinum]|nr:acyl-CoA dehydrogenase family protein [Dactylosporangium sucinum]